MSTLAMNIHYGLRLLKRNPAFAAIAVIILAVGIAGVSIIFSIVSAIVIRPLPYADPQHLAVVWEARAANTQVPVSPDDYEGWRAQSDTFADLAAFSIQGLSLTNVDLPLRINGAVVSPNYFQLFGVEPILGRTFTPDMVQSGGARFAVISSGLWKRLFGEGESVLGRQLTLNDQTYVVVGVVPNNFDFTRLVDIWLSPQQWVPEPPVRMNQTSLRGLHYLRVVGRLKHDATLSKAQAEMETITARLAGQHQDPDEEISARVVPLYEEVVGNVRTAVLFLFGAMLFVLLIACSNIANLLLGRTMAREREFGIRLALGASRGQIFQQLLTESLLLSLVAGATGLILAFLGVRFLPVVLPGDFPTVNEIKLNGMVVGITVLASVSSGVIFGLAPAFQSLKSNLIDSLRAGTRGGTGGRIQRRFRNALVIAEITLSLVLLIGAGLMIKSFYNLRRLNLGFNPENVLTMQISLPRSRYSEPDRVIGFYNQVLEHFRTVPGVRHVGAVNRLPMTGTGVSGPFTIKGRPTSPGEAPNAGWRMVDPGYFQTMGILLKRGRLFKDSDVNGPGVVLVNETAAMRYWPNEDPIGKHINIESEEEKWLEIVGIVGDVRGPSLYAEPASEIYLPYFQTPWNTMVIVAKLDPNLPNPTPALREKVLATDKDQPADNIKPLEQIVEESMAQPRFNLILISFFTVLALILTAIGLYGVMATSVTQRTREIGIRMALGAKPTDILRLILSQGLLLVIIGSAIGLCLAFALNQSIASLLYNVQAKDMTIYLAATIFLLLIATLANVIPAYKASRVNPLVAMREE